MPNALTYWAIRARHLLSHVFEYWLNTYEGSILLHVFGNLWIYPCRIQALILSTLLQSTVFDIVSRTVSSIYTLYKSRCGQREYVPVGFKYKCVSIYRCDLTTQRNTVVWLWKNIRYRCTKYTATYSSTTNKIRHRRFTSIANENDSTTFVRRLILAATLQLFIWVTWRRWGQSSHVCLSKLRLQFISWPEPEPIITHCQVDPLQHT